MAWNVFERSATLHHLAGTAIAFPKYFAKNYGVKAHPVLCMFKKGIVFCGEKDSLEIGLEIIEKIRQKSELFGTIKKNWKTHVADFDSACKKVEKSNLATASDAELLALYQGIDEPNQQQLGWALIWDFWDVALNHAIEKKLKSIMGENIGGKRFNDVFATLTAPLEMSFANKEEIALLEIAQKIRLDKKMLDVFETENLRLIEENLPKLDVALNALVDRHVSDFVWIRSSYEGANSLQKRDVLSLLFERVKEKNLEEKIEEMQDFGKKLGKKKAELLEELGSDKELFFLVKIVDELGFLHDTKKEIQMKFFVLAEQILEEIGKRVGLGLEDMLWSLPHEHAEWLEKKEGNKRICAERKRLSFLVFHSDKIEEHYGKDAGEKEKEFFGVSAGQEKVMQIAGMSANTGTAIGKARVLRSAKEIGEMRNGEVLVTGMTSPEFVPAMRKAAAIVTDEGGILCHAAIVSRELGLPCIVGTQIATKALKTGMLLEVRANHGIINILG